MTTTTKHRCFIPEIEYYCRNCACVKKLRVGTCHGTSRTFGPGKDRGLSVRPLFYLSGPSDRRHLGKTATLLKHAASLSIFSTDLLFWIRLEN